MAGNSRDIQFVIKARDEASRAFDGIAQALADLVDAQSQLSGGAGKVNTDLNAIVATLSKFDSVSKQIAQSSSTADAAFTKQAAKVAELRTQLNALEEQRIASVRAQGSVTSAGLATGNTEAAAAQSKAIQAAQAQLEKQIARSTTALQREISTLTDLGSQQHNVTALATALRDLEPNVSKTRDQLQAVQAISGYAREIGASVEKEAAAREKAATALRDQAAAARGEVAAQQSQTGINAQLGVTANPKGAQAAQSAAVFQEQIAAAEAVAGFAKQINVEVTKEVSAREKAAQLLRDQAASAKEEVAQSAARAKFDNLLGVTNNPNGAQAAQSAAVFQAAADNEERLAAAAERYRGIINPTLVIQNRFTKELADARDLQKQGLITAQELVLVERQLAAEQKRALGNASLGANGKPSFLGLKPYEMTNLGYQVNDIVSGLASGQGIMQIIAQQGGQVLQLIPRLGAGIMAALTNPAILASAAVFGTIAFAMKEAADQAERLRVIATILRANADGAAYNAKAINEDIKAMSDFGISADEATTIVRTFIKDGLNPQYFEEFGLAAKDMSRILGTDVKKAAEDVTAAFTGNYTDIVKLDEAFNFLSVNERKSVRDAFESGKAADARSEAFKIFQRQMGDTAGHMRGDWASSFDHLGVSWEHLKNSLADSQWANALLKILDSLADTLDQVAGAFDGVRNAKARLDQSGVTGGGGSLPPLPGPFAVIPEIVNALQPGGPSTGQGTSSVTVHLDPVGDIKGPNSPGDKAAADARELADLQQQLADAETSADRIRLSGVVAYKEAALAGKSAAEAALASETARKDVIRQIEQQAVGLFTKNIVAAEGGPGKNPFSSANGFGQFTDGRWLEEFKKAFGGNNGLTDKQILAKKTEADTAKVVIDQQARDLATSLHGLNQVVSATNLYLAHFLGPGGAAAVLKANPNTPVDQIGLSKGALSGNQGYLRTDNGKGRYRTAGELQTFIAGRIGDTKNDQYGAERDGIAALLQKQQALNTAIAAENEQRQLAISYLQKEQGATVDEKNALERQKAIDEAIKQARDKAKNAETTLTPDQEKAISDSVGKQYDLANAEKLVNDRLAEQQNLRQAILKAIDDAQQRGDTTTVGAMTQALEQTTPALNAAIDAAEKYWSQFNSPQAKAALKVLKQLRQEVADTAAQLAKIHADHADTLVGGATSLQSALQGQVGQQQLLGDSAGARQTEQALAAVNIQLVTLAQNAIAAREAMLQMSDEQLASIGKTREGLQAEIIGLQQVQQESAMMGRQFLMSGKQINEMLSDQLVSGVQNFLTMVSQGKNVFSSLAIAAGQTAAQILMDLGQMILKQALFNALSAHSASGGGGVGGSIAAAAAALFPASIMLQSSGTVLGAAGGTLMAAAGAWAVTAAQLQAAATTLMIANTASVAAAHTGGIAGSPSMTRSVSPFAFLGAMRYHSGGIAGLRPNEVPTILERGEEVLTKGDPRHRNNLSAGSSNSGGGDAGLGGAAVDLSNAAAALMDAAKALNPDGKGGGGILGTIMNSLAGGGGILGGLGGGGLFGILGNSSATGGGAGLFSKIAHFHTGGLAGLKPDEIPAVLQRGEEVLTKSDPRHRNNMARGAGGGDMGGLKQVLVMDPNEIPSAMSSSKGEKVIMTVIGRNRRTLQQMIKS